jgi:predicted  nucleic acid-binding Zn-ribbon protein
MVEPTDIEKKSLEAHVELCAERYNALENKINTVDDKITHLCAEITDVKDTLRKMSEKNNDRLIGWGIGIIGTLVAIVGYFISHYIIK